jgi:hypothetical protein
MGAAELARPHSTRNPLKWRQTLHVPPPAASASNPVNPPHKPRPPGAAPNSGGPGSTCCSTLEHRAGPGARPNGHSQPAVDEKDLHPIPTVGCPAACPGGGASVGQAAGGPPPAAGATPRGEGAHPAAAARLHLWHLHKHAQSQNSRIPKRAQCTGAGAARGARRAAPPPPLPSLSPHRGRTYNRWVVISSTLSLTHTYTHTHTQWRQVRIESPSPHPCSPCPCPCPSLKPFPAALCCLLERWRPPAHMS